MTRETTVGVVVSCSFLCLVGLVLANKMREGERKDDTVSEEQISSALEDPKPAEGGSGQPPAIVPLVPSQTHAPGGPQPGPVAMGETPALSPAPSSSGIMPVTATSLQPGKI